MKGCRDSGVKFGVAVRCCFYASWKKKTRVWGRRTDIRNPTHKRDEFGPGLGPGHLFTQFVLQMG